MRDPIALYHSFQGTLHFYIRKHWNRGGAYNCTEVRGVRTLLRIPRGEKLSPVTAGSIREGTKGSPQRCYP